MFNLDQHIQSWRESAARSLGDGEERLDELEAHLRDEFDRLAAAGAAPDRAWDESLRKLGSPQALAGEFAKVGPRPRWLPAWVAAGALALGVLAVAWMVVARLSAGAFRPLLAAHVVSVTAGYGALFAIGFLGICAAVRRAVAGWDDRRDAAFRSTGAALSLLALVATAAGVVLGAWWSRGGLGRWWGWDPREIGGLCALAWAGLLFQSFRWRHSTPQSRMLVAVTGNMVVALAWFGPVLLEATRFAGHAYGGPSPTLGMLLGGFLVAQIGVAYLLVLPAGVAGRRLGT